MIATLHFAESAFPLHLLFERFQCLIDIVVAYENLNDDTSSWLSLPAIAKSAVRPEAEPLGRGFTEAIGPCPPLGRRFWRIGGGRTGA